MTDHRSRDSLDRAEAGLVEHSRPGEGQIADGGARLAARDRHGRWLAYSAAGWAFVFAAMSCYWAVAVMLGAERFPGALDAARSTGHVFVEQARRGEPGFIALLWITGALKLMAGLIALALVRGWGRMFPRRARLVAAWLAGGFITLYALANLIDHGLMAAGVRATPEGLGSTALRWHLILWDPWWLLGGVLFIAAAWSARRRSER